MMRGTEQLSPIGAVSESVSVAVLAAAAVAVHPWTTVAQSANLPSKLDGRAFVAGSYRATAPFRGDLVDLDRAALRKVDFRRNVVVAAFRKAPSCGYKLHVLRLDRVRRRLTVTIRLEGPPGTVNCMAVTQPYHVIAVSRRVLHSPLPTRVVVRTLPPVSTG
jgi:hypothetical protein